MSEIDAPLCNHVVVCQTQIFSNPDILYEDVDPAAILDVRPVAEGSEEKQYLVRWADDTDDSWVRFVTIDGAHLLCGAGVSPVL